MENKCLVYKTTRTKPLLTQNKKEFYANTTRVS